MVQQELQIGQSIEGRYEIVDELGRGGFGVVYEARQSSTGQRVAIKLLSHLSDAQRARFDREMKLLSRLSHPHMVNLVDSGHLEERPFFVLEFIDGTTLADRLQSDGPLTTALAKRVTIQSLEALELAHAKGIVHRDLKPENIMLTGSRRRPATKVLDFGVASVHADDSEDWKTLTQEGATVGTPHYMAPELVMPGRFPEAAPSARSDIYAMGLILFECLTGGCPFDGESPLEVMVQQVERQLELPEFVERTQFAPILLRACAKQPEDRYATAEQMIAALEGVEASSHPAAEGVAYAPTMTPRTPNNPPETDGGHQQPTVEDVDSSHQGVEESEQSLGGPESPTPGPQADDNEGSTRLLVIVGVLGLLVVGVAAVAIGLATGSEDPQPTRSPSGESAATAEPKPSTPPITVAVNSDPEGATVFNGKSELLGTTPLELPFDEGGRTLSLTLEHEDFAPTTVSVRLPPTDDDSTVRIPITRKLTESKEQVWTLRSDPSASVRLGEETLCDKTPCKISRARVSGGDRTVLVESDGHEPAHVDLPEKPGPVEVRLEKRQQRDPVPTAFTPPSTRSTESEDAPAPDADRREGESAVRRDEPGDRRATGESTESEEPDGQDLRIKIE